MKADSSNRRGWLANALVFWTLLALFVAPACATWCAAKNCGHFAVEASATGDSCRHSVTGWEQAWSFHSPAAACHSGEYSAILSSVAKTCVTRREYRAAALAAADIPCPADGIQERRYAFESARSLSPHAVGTRVAIAILRV